MEPRNWPRIEELFLAAADLHGAELLRFLEAECAGMRTRAWRSSRYSRRIASKGRIFPARSAAKQLLYSTHRDLSEHGSALTGSSRNWAAEGWVLSISHA